MVTIDVLTSEEEAKRKLGHYNHEAHKKIHREINAIMHQRWLEHLVASGEQNSELSSITPSPDSSPKKFYNKLYAGAGNGFEVPLLVHLYAHEDGFAHQYGNVYPPTRGDCGAWGRFADDEDRLTDLSKLAQSVKQRISEDKNLFFGAEIMPVLYTIRGKRIYGNGVEPIYKPTYDMPPNERKKLKKEALKLLDILDTFGVLTSKEKREAKAKIKNADFTEEIVGYKDREIYTRGLTEEEIKEFERLFNRQ